MKDAPIAAEQKADNQQLIVDKINSSTNILVTVSRDPSVDDLSAALGLTALLNKLGKHATAIFSGTIPPAITFLEPDKIFENTIDSLRDFIIALDKEKADHLRYKVDGDVVKIFITPYRTVITGEDLEFSQGDYNVELVLALGVENQEHLDNSLAAHGQVLHDAVVVTLSAGEKISQLGSIDWHDDNASSLCEMVTIISDFLKTDKPVLDKQIATALLTGIVAATDRFSNLRTSSRVMTLAAQLMAAGADQQLIASRLQESHQIQSIVVPEPVSSVEQPSTLPDGSLAIVHESDDKKEEVAEPDVDTNNIPPANNLIRPIDPKYPLSTLAPTETPAVLPDDVPAVEAEATTEPSLGGELNSTTEQVSENAKREAEDQKNTTLLSHSYVGNAESSSHNASNLIGSAGQVDENQNIDVFNDSPAPGTLADEEFKAQSSLPTDTMPTLSLKTELQPEVVPQVSPRDSDEVRVAEATLDPQPVAPTPNFVSGLPMPPPVPDFSASPPLPPFPEFVATPALPDMNTPLPSQQPNDPSQFQIPGQ